MKNQGRHSIKILGLLSLLWFLGFSVSAADIIVVPDKIPFGKTTKVSDNVRAECKLEEKIAKFIVDYGKKHSYQIVKEKPSSGSYMVLSAEIISVVGTGGGAWSGSKSVKIQGDLKDQARKVIATFTAGRVSGGGAFAGYKGTCAILGRCTKTIGKDVAGWLANPTNDAMLGDH